MVSMVTYRMSYGVNSCEGGMAPLQEGKDGMEEKITLPKQCRRAICNLLSLWTLLFLFLAIVCIVGTHLFLIIKRPFIKAILSYC